jgi:hypothetical protein
MLRRADERAFSEKNLRFARHRVPQRTVKSDEPNGIGGKISSTGANKRRSGGQQGITDSFFTETQGRNRKST